MARAALTIGGAVIGSFFGMPQLGAVVGGVAGALLFPGPPIKGPRLDDVAMAPGTYGSPLAIAYGDGLIAGDLIWVEGNELKEVRKKSGGKGGPTQVTYQYFATFAVAVSDREIGGVRRIWFGDELVFDASAEALEAAIASGDTLPLTGPVAGLTVRVYTGSATQQPDPRIQAEDPNAPAFLGVAYLVFEDVPLEKFGNRIPPVMVEVTSGPKKNPVAKGPVFSRQENPLLPSIDSETGRIFWDGASWKPRVEVWDSLAGGALRIDDFNGVPHPWYDPSWQRSPPSTIGDSIAAPYYGYAPVCSSPDGTFYIIDEVWGAALSTRFGGAHVIDAATGQWLACLGTLASRSGNSYFGFAASSSSYSNATSSHVIRELNSLPPDPLTGARRYLYARNIENRYIFFGAVSFTDRGAVEAQGLADTGVSTSPAQSGRLDVSPEGYMFWGARVSGVNYLKRFTVPGVPTGLSSADYWSNALLPDTEINPPAWTGNITDIVVNPDAQTVAVIAPHGVEIYDYDLNLITTRLYGTEVRVPKRPSASGRHSGYVWVVARDDPEGVLSGDFLVGISTADGSLIKEDLAQWGYTWGTTGSAAVWSAMDRGSRNRYMVVEDPVGASALPIALFYDHYSAGTVPLADVIADVCKRAGLKDADIDVSAVSRDIIGAPQKGAQLTARGVLEDLLVMTDHEAVLSGARIVFRPRPTTSSATLTEDDLGADGGLPVKRRMLADGGPRRMEIAYRSFEAGHDIAEQADSFPVEVAPEGDVMRLQTSLVMTDDEAWAAVQRILTTLTAERVEVEVAVPYTRLDIEAGDVVTPTASDVVIDMRVREISGSSTLVLRGVQAAPLLALAGTPIDSSRPPPTLSEVSPTRLALIDSHILRDEDDSPAFHVAAWPLRPTWRWPGAVIYRSTQPEAFDDEFLMLEEGVPAGQATGTLGDVVSSNFWDRKNTLVVRMVNGTPTSATAAEVYAGANVIWVECGQTGEWEIVQYTTATENPDGTWTLSNLLRGRRGTEHLTGLHQPGDRVVWADPAAVRRVGGSTVGTAWYYVAGSIGTVEIDPSTVILFTNTARGKRPYSPARVRGARDGSGNLTITWLRRSRIWGSPFPALRPLGESTEAYEVDILDGSGNVVRTISGLTSPTATYTAADQTTDFGSPQPSVLVRVYQVSDIYGLGVPAEKTL